MKTIKEKGVKRKANKLTTEQVIAGDDMLFLGSSNTPLSTSHKLQQRPFYTLKDLSGHKQKRQPKHAGRVLSKAQVIEAYKHSIGDFIKQNNTRKSNVMKSLESTPVSHKGTSQLLKAEPHIADNSYFTNPGKDHHLSLLQKSYAMGDDHQKQSISRERQLQLDLASKESGYPISKPHSLNVA